MGTLTTKLITMLIPPELVPVIEELLKLSKENAFGSIEVFFQNGRPNPTVNLHVVKRLKANEDSIDGP